MEVDEDPVEVAEVLGNLVFFRVDSEIELPYLLRVQVHHWVL
jgi:hypothetical protein